MSQFKLDDSLLETSLRYKHLTLHKVRNCLRRNIISQSRSVNAYEQNLRQENFYNEECSTILSLICSKDAYTPDDRNSLRRIMLSKLDEQLIQGVKNQAFFNYVRFTKLQKNATLTISKDQQKFWMLLTGKARYLNSMGYSLTVHSGRYFGHEEILAGVEIVRVVALEDCSIMHVPEEAFMDYLSEWFQQKIQLIDRETSRKISMIQGQHTFWQIHFCFSLQKITCKSGSILCKQGSPIKYVYIVVKGSLSDCHQSAINRYFTVGLKEVLQNASEYKHTVVCEGDCELYLASPKTLLMCVNIPHIKQLFNLRQYTETQQKQKVLKQRKFQFRIRHAKITLSRSSRKDRSIDSAMITNDFYFLSDRHSFVKDKLKIRKEKTRGRHVHTTTDDPESVTEGLYSKIQ